MSRYRLVSTENGYALKDALSIQSPLQINFSSGQLEQRRVRGGKKELLIKAVKAKPGLNVWDCTAGLGTDSLLLADAGCQVTMFERSPVMHLLLAQALSWAAEDEALAPIAARMTLKKVDARLWLARAPEPPDVIYIDPMFPARKKSAQVNGAMQMLQGFIGKDEDALSLLAMAKASGCARVVVKRPVVDVIDLGAPDFSLSAKANRFDVFLQPRG